MLYALVDVCIYVVVEYKYDVDKQFSAVGVHYVVLLMSCRIE